MVMEPSDSSPQALRLLPASPHSPGTRAAPPALEKHRCFGEAEEGVPVGWAPGLWVTAKGSGGSSLVLGRGSFGRSPHSVHCRLRGQLRDGRISQILTQSSWVKKARPFHGPGK